MICKRINLYTCLDLAEHYKYYEFRKGIRPRSYTRYTLFIKYWHENWNINNLRGMDAMRVITTCWKALEASQKRAWELGASEINAEEERNFMLEYPKSEYSINYEKLVVSLNRPPDFL